MDGRNTGRMGFSHAAEDSAENMMAAVKAGKIRKHLMGNNSPIRYGTMEKRDRVCQDFFSLFLIIF